MFRIEQTRHGTTLYLEKCTHVIVCTYILRLSVETDVKVWSLARVVNRNSLNV